jgi:hypothetical protein
LLFDRLPQLVNLINQRLSAQPQLVALLQEPEHKPNERNRRGQAGENVPPLIGAQPFLIAEDEQP